MESKKIRNATKDILEAIDMKKDVSGYQVWIDAVELVINEENKISRYDFTLMNICIELAKRSKLKVTTIEAKMRHSLEDIRENIQLYFRN